MRSFGTARELGVHRGAAAEERPSVEIRETRTVERVSDAELVERALDGDRRAEEAIFRRHVREVTGLAMRMLGDRTEAEDVVQDTFVTALAELGSLRNPSVVGGWILRIAVRKIHRRFRRRKLLRALGLDRTEHDLPLHALVGSDAGPELGAELVKLARALERLPTKNRVAWVLRHVEGYSLQEAADACACSLATIKRRIRAACHELSKTVSVPGEGGADD